MKKIRSVSRAVRILEAFSDGKLFTVTELSRTLKLPKSSLFEILATLVAEGMVAKDDETNQYHLGLKLLGLASSARQGLEVSRAAQPLLKRLNETLNETVQLTILDKDEVLYVDGFESTKQLRTFFSLGDRAPLHCTAVGKAILAFLPKTEIRRIIRSKGVQRFTSNTLSDERRLFVDLERTVARGYSIDNVEHEEGVRCVGAPVRNRQGEAFAAISVSGPSHRLLPERDKEIARLVVDAAEEISRRLGYAPAEKGGE